MFRLGLWSFQVSSLLLVFGQLVRAERVWGLGQDS